MFIDTIKAVCDQDKVERRKNISRLITRDYQWYMGDNNTNIVIPALNQYKKVTTLTAHYDVFPDSMGYNDNGSGIAVILDIMNKVPDNVEIVFTDNEECGGRGADFYIRSNLTRIHSNINVDVVGLGEKIYYDILETTIPSHSNFHFDEGYDPIRYVGVPFNDSFIYRKYGIPTMLVVAGTKGYSGIITEIWNAQHRNINDDDLDMLSETGMRKVADFILDALWMDHDIRERK